MNSFTGYIGGKKNLRERIVSEFPQDYKKYVEVFVGAGWVLFHKERSKNEVFNDFNGHLITLYKCIKYHSEELQKELDFMVNSRKVFDESKMLLSDGYAESLTDIQRAARYFYILKESYGNNCRDFKTGNIPDCLKVIDYLKDVQERLKNVVIENRSYEEILKWHDKSDTLFYLDPPYYKTEKMYKEYTAEFALSDHENLCQILKGIKGKFVLSYNDCEFIRQLYKDFPIKEVKRMSNLTARYRKSGQYGELIIKNY